MILQPEEIERESMRIIGENIDSSRALPENLPVIKRVIHATADFDFLHTLTFTPDAVNLAREALRNHAPIITDTLMLASGISKRYGVEIICHVADSDVKDEAKSRKITRSIVSIERSALEYPSAVYAIGNAPTALIRLCELIREGHADPALVVGVPVGFVNVIEAKEMLASLTSTPSIISHGRKGGTTVACAIINAILYGLE
ncbi:MAG: precorrin-8X methylmutase [Synergistaceae bacterium]|nr:precorrin-8X methylmutase [Synergistaceae bacterium]